MTHSCSSSSCEAGLPDDYRCAEEPTRFATGEVLAIEESVYTPIEHLFSDPVSGLRGASRNYSTASLNNLRTRGRATNKTPRPCILSETVYLGDKSIKGDGNPAIWLMATFEGTPMHTLPPVYQFFCIAVYPTHPLCPVQTPPTIPLHDPEVHLHSLPEWPLSDTAAGQCSQWIIAWLFETTRPLLGRWLTPEARRQSKGREAEDSSGGSDAARDERTGVTFGVRAYEALEIQTEERRQLWQRLCCSDRQFALERQREFVEWRDARRKSQSSVYSASYRSNSQKEGYCKAAPSRIGRSIMNETIREDQVSVFQDERPAFNGRTQSVFGGNHTKDVKGGRESWRSNSRTASVAPYPNPATKQQRSERKSVKSTAGASIAGSHASKKPQKLFAQIGNRFSVLSNMRRNSLGDA
ncbi:hypothetical protein GY45DRAFT_1327005 [Cubamyces sp. BRFM 1775]|nr:hypothetical protein GY45DRAFT_1327005 [Cubamyces sp. BRFM 1775]